MKSRTPITLLLIVLLIFSTITAQTRDRWSSVRTNHLFVIGNTDPENLRRVAVWLEYFHAAFARLISRNVIDSSVPTTVIVFRDDASFTPFKPAYNGRTASISGFFLPGDDVNYIVLSLEPRGDPYATAFHEYVHLHVKDNVPNAPLWLNEGLAELYEALQFSGTDAVIGMPEHNYLYLLRQSEMLPLKTLFSIGTDSPHYNERDKAGIFYGESWALVHYLMFGDRARGDQFKRFLQRVANGEDAAKAIESTYGTTLDVIEQELETYVRRGNLTAQRIAGIANSEAYRSYTATQRSTLTDSEATYYLADMMLHSGRDKAAERGFKEAIAQDPSFIPAYAALGKLYVEQRRYAEAKPYLQKATQPTRTTSSRVLGVESGPVAINDGGTVESSGALPAVEEVLDKYVQAIGGAAALNAVTSSVEKGTFDVVGVIRGGTYEIYTVAPDKTRTIIRPDPTETSRFGYNGHTAWITNLKKKYVKFTLAGKSKIGYRDVYVIDLQKATGAVDRIFLDAGTYLLVRMNTNRMSKGVSLPVEIYYDDWQEVGGLKAPHIITESSPKQTTTFTVKEIKNNIPVDTKIFEKP